MITEKVNLIAGIKHNGKLHKSLVMRSPIIKDSIEAEEEAREKGSLFLSLCLIAKSIVSFGDIPAEEITAGLLIGMEEEDLDRLHTVREFIKKKMHWSNEN